MAKKKSGDGLDFNFGFNRVKPKKAPKSTGKKSGGKKGGNAWTAYVKGR